MEYNVRLLCSGRPTEGNIGMYLLMVLPIQKAALH